MLNKLFWSPSCFTSCTSAFCFHTTAVVAQLPHHRLYQKVDWDKVDSGMYAIVDPVSPDRILYLTEQDYIIQVRVAFTNNRNIKLLAGPGDAPEPTNNDHKSSDSPSNRPHTPHPFLQEMLSANPSRTNSRRVGHLFHSGFQKWIYKKTVGLIRGAMIEVDNRNIITVITRWHDIMSWWSRGSVMSTVIAAERATFARSCALLLRVNGVQFLILYLKASLFIVNSFLSGKKLARDQVPGKVWVRTVNGLPRILPIYVRNGIRTRNLHFIRVWTSVLNMYKGLLGVWPMEDILSTIRQPPPLLGPRPEFWFYRSFVKIFWNHLKVRYRVDTPDLTIKRMFVSSKAGPNNPNVVLGAARDAYLWTYDWVHLGAPSNLVKDWLDATGNKACYDLFRRAAKTYRINYEVLKAMAPKIEVSPGQTFNEKFNQLAGLITGFDRLAGRRNYDEGLSVPCIVGKLHTILEAAGKVRVVAIVDYWTHCILKPLHDWMFRMLKLIPQDATFDQEGRVETFSRQGYEDLWSIDLSAATDTIPRELYKLLFYPILGRRITNLWLSVLVDRDYFLPSKTPTTDGLRVRYNRGQPMGALSSWAMLAVFHHCLVQLAAYSASTKFLSDLDASQFCDDVPLEFNKFEWFTDYLVLGDDLVIHGERVAREYVRLAEGLGVKVGLPKSYISEKGFFNFANQSYLGDKNISPLSFKEYVGIDSLAGRCEMVLRAFRRGWISDDKPNILLKIVKRFVTKSTWDKITADLARGINHPIGSWVASALLVPGKSKLSPWLPEVSIRLYLAAMLQKVDVWNKPKDTLNDLISNDVHWRKIEVILSSAVNILYGDFLLFRKRLGDIDKWIDFTISTDSEALVKLIFKETFQDRFQEWETKYRHALKAMQVCLPPKAKFEAIHFEMGTGLSIDENVKILAEAAEALPRIPDFSKLDFSDFEKVESKLDPSSVELRGFSALLAMVGGLEHLHRYDKPGYFGRSEED